MEEMWFRDKAVEVRGVQIRLFGTCVGSRIKTNWWLISLKWEERKNPMLRFLLSNRVTLFLGHIKEMVVLGSKYGLETMVSLGLEVAFSLASKYQCENVCLRTGQMVWVT